MAWISARRNLAPENWDWHSLGGLALCCSFDCIHFSSWLIEWVLRDCASHACVLSTWAPVGAGMRSHTVHPRVQMNIHRSMPPMQIFKRRVKLTWKFTRQIFILHWLVHLTYFHSFDCLKISSGVCQGWWCIFGSLLCCHQTSSNWLPNIGDLDLGRN